MNHPQASLSRRFAVLGIVALAIWMTAWMSWLSPSVIFPKSVATGLALAPILPALLLIVFRRPSAVYWGGVAALLYFCHAISEWWTTPEIWPLPVIELLLALWIIFCGNWDGLRAKLFKRKKAESA
jgi:uncharacterized membrane protein